MQERRTSATRLRTGTGVPCPYSRGWRCGSISRAGWLGRPAACRRARRKKTRGTCDGGNSLGGLDRGLGANYWKRVGHDSSAFFYGDDSVDGHAGQFFNQPAGPSDFERIDFGAFAEAEKNARIACGHITHAALGLFDVGGTFGGELKGGADAVAIGFGADQQNLQPVIGVAAVVAQ